MPKKNDNVNKQKEEFNKEESSNEQINLTKETKQKDDVEVKVYDDLIIKDEGSDIKSTQILSKEDLVKALKESKEKKRLTRSNKKTKTSTDNKDDIKSELEEKLNNTNENTPLIQNNSKIEKTNETELLTEEEIDQKVLDKLDKKNKKNKKEKKDKEELSEKQRRKLESAVRFFPEIEFGLTKADVEQRNKDELTNKDSNSTGKTYAHIIFKNLFTFFNILMLAIGIALICVGQYSDCFFLIIVVANTAIGIIQEVKAKITVDKLKLVTAPNSKVIRDGEIQNIPTDQLVLDDIMLLSSGNQIGADAIVKIGQIEVNESLLTGESLAIKKKPGDMVLAGSFVVSGSCTCQVEKIGSLCYANALQQQAKKYSKPKSELVRSLNGIIKVISFIVLPIAIVLFWLNFRAAPNNITDVWGQSGKVAFAIKSTAGSIIGMIPSGLFLLTSTALAAGILRLAKYKTSIQEMYSIEMLARTNCLCLDKTGTLTDGTMKVAEVVIFDKTYNMDELMGSYLSSFQESNQTSIALANYYPFCTAYRVRDSIPFSSARKFSAVSFEDNGTFLLGAPEYIYHGKNEQIKRYIASKQKLGYRVLMLCRSDEYIKDGNFDGVAKPVAIFVLLDNVRKEAPDTIKWFNDNGVDIKIISGDNPFTASNIAKTCGVIDAEKCVSLDGVSIQETKELATRFTVFGRVSPEQKAALIEALKNQGRTVSMTGDGVNDILAMKKADCSIAMASGADAAKNVSHLVLLDSNFASMPKVVEEGRRVVNNVQRSSSLFLMKTIFTVCLTLFIIIMNLAGKTTSYPFSPSNMFLMEVFSIGVPAFFLSLQPNKSLIKGKFMKNTLLRSIPGALSMLSVVGIISLMHQYHFFELVQSDTTTTETIKTIMVYGLMTVGLTEVFIQCRPLNLYRTSLFSVMLVCSVLCAFLLPSYLTGLDYRGFNKILWLMFIILLFALPAFTIGIDMVCSIFRDDLDKSLKKEDKPSFFGNLFKKKHKNNKDNKEEKDNSEEVNIQENETIERESSVSVTSEQSVVKVKDS